MTSTNAAPSNARPTSGKAKVAEAAYREAITAASRRGFFGSITLTLKVQDGAIQHVVIGSERTLR